MGKKQKEFSTTPPNQHLYAVIKPFIDANISIDIYDTNGTYLSDYDYLKEDQPSADSFTVIDLDFNKTSGLKVTIDTNKQAKIVSLDDIRHFYKEPQPEMYEKHLMLFWSSPTMAAYNSLHEKNVNIILTEEELDYEQAICQEHYDPNAHSNLTVYRLMYHKDSDVLEFILW